VLVQGNNFDRNPRYLVNGFDNSENNGLVLRRVSDSSISGNVIAGVWRKRAAIDALDCQRLMLQNNQILDSDGAAILLENCRRCMVSGNLASDSRQEGRRPGVEVLGGSAQELELSISGNNP
jgi:parallel beta-helix repeat protein